MLSKSLVPIMAASVKSKPVNVQLSLGNKAIQRNVVDGTVKHAETWRTPLHNTPEMEPSWMKDAHAAKARAAEKRYRESAYRNKILTR